MTRRGCWFNNQRRIIRGICVGEPCVLQYLVNASPHRISAQISRSPATWNYHYRFWNYSHGQCRMSQFIWDSGEFHKPIISPFPFCFSFRHESLFLCHFLFPCILFPITHAFYSYFRRQKGIRMLENGVNETNGEHLLQTMAKLKCALCAVKLLLI